MILADATPTPNSLMEFLLCIGFLANIAVAGVTLFGARRSQKRDVRILDEEYALKSDLTALNLRFDQLMIKGEERAINLHNRLNPVAENTANIKGSMEAFTQSFENFTQALIAIKDRK